LAKAFRGELVPTEADLAGAEGRDYETAEQLLARVAARKTEPTKTTRKPRVIHKTVEHTIEIGQDISMRTLNKDAVSQPARRADMYQEDPNETEIFIDAMDCLVKARGDSVAVAKALDWQNVGELLDIGSGPATYPIEICKRFSNIRATILDLPGTLKITERYVRDAGMTQRIQLIAGDYRQDPLGGQYDVIFLSNIIHGEDDGQNETLVAKLSRHLKPSGRMVIKDHILDETRANPPVGAIFSLLMLLTTSGGRCYSFGEVKSWMEVAGLSRVEQIDLPPPLTSSLVIGAR
jgi:SAM-dependent methyltransferase